MAFVYILQSRKNGNYYIGSTDNIEQRIKQHQKGRVISTKGLLPVDIVFKQACDDIKTARLVEKRIKRLKRKDYIQKIIEDGYIKILDKI
ncbi:MAG: GIY-YIG nuclease family protein [Candidatus Omnitrophica bacterium]|nr:GIY-YIG nuclease family protein [Candidatus Omnitrophota bacterium]